MIEIDKLDIKSLELIIDYAINNHKDIDTFIGEFGEVNADNGYGTLFLKPKNPLFRTFWVVCKNNEIQIVGFGGPNLGLTLKDLLSAYPQRTEGYNRYDDEYIYVFFKGIDYHYTIRVPSKIKIIENGEIIDNLKILEMEISLVVKPGR